MNLRFGSVSSGIGGDVVAWHPLGWEHVFCSEIAEFPSAVLAARCPDVPNLGDFTAADFCDRARACGSIDVFAGGTPCQAFSVAGKRGSLDDNRGNLTLRFVEIAHELNPAVVVWENVPGVLSTEDNAFGCFLGGMVGAKTALVPCDDCGSHYAKRYWRTRVVQDKEGEPSECWRYPVWPDYGMVAGPERSLAWRILDAQHFGLAQRRRRVIVVSFRTRDGINPGAVLFEPESLRRDSPPSREEGAGVAGSLAGCSEGSGHRCGADEAAAGHIVAGIPEISPAIKTRDHKGPSSDGDGDGAPLIPTVAATLRPGPEGGKSHGKLNGSDRMTLVPCAFNSRQDPDVSGDLSGALDGGHPQAQAVAFETRFARNGRGAPSEIVPPLKAESGQTGKGDGAPCVLADLRVRRLMPVECSRLQGFADHWTRIPWKSKPAAECPDGHQYKGLGNAWATNVFRWLGHRLELVLRALKTRPRWLGKPKR